jgi:arabinan endo-1,5-alpha-L-arabinosidase
MRTVIYQNPIQPESIHIRDPHILAHDGYYYLYGTSRACWDTKGDGFDAWYSDDLVHWQFHGSVYDRPADATWNQYNFWAPEVYERGGRFYMYYAAKSDTTRRALGVAVSDSPLGPFLDCPYNPITPPEWECLDATLYTDPQGKSWLFWVHEWVQAPVGEMYVQPLAEDLMRFDGEKTFLFGANEASWANPVIDGPSLLVHEGRYYLMWSSFWKEGYCGGYAVADNLLGPYTQSAEPIITGDGGHNSWFVGPDGKTLYTSYHRPNKSPDERLCIDRLYFDGAGNLRVDQSWGQERWFGFVE